LGFQKKGKTERETKRKSLMDMFFPKREARICFANGRSENSAAREEKEGR